MSDITYMNLLGINSDEEDIPDNEIEAVFNKGDFHDVLNDSNVE